MERELIKICKRYKIVIIARSIVILYMICFGMGYLDGIDVLCQVYVHSFISQSMTMIMKVITFFGSAWCAFLFCLIYIFINRKEGIKFSIFMFFAMICNIILKVSIARLRPPVEHLIVVEGFSFPSYHAMISFVLFGYFAYRIYHQNKFFSFVLMVMVLLVGISRIYLGVHYFSDIIGGYLYGFALLSTFLSVLNNHKNLLKT